MQEQTAQPGQEVAVGAILGHIQVSGDAVDHSPSHGHAASAPAKIAVPLPSPAPSENGSHLPVPARAAGAGYYSPRLRARMSELGLRHADISAIKGTGRAGRVNVKDLERFLEEVASANVQRASPMRVAVADSMRRSWMRPLATVAMELDVSPLSAHRRTIKGRPSATVYGIKALAMALKNDDRLACRLVGDRLIHPRRMDIAFAVETEDGVVTPVIEDPASKTLAELTVCYETAFKAAQDPRTVAQVLARTGIATVSNYGTFGITWATPIPLPDQTMVLGIGALRKVPDWNPATKTWGVATMLEVTMTFDHRVADGGAAGRLLKNIIDLLKSPQRLEPAL
jgi:pyruvate/2-oxoglutarate dehydrogenase complex dihydrolipoamide acyltransferase (E2) component